MLYKLISKNCNPQKLRKFFYDLSPEILFAFYDSIEKKDDFYDNAISEMQKIVEDEKESNIRIKTSVSLPEEIYQELEEAEAKTNRSKHILALYCLQRAIVEFCSECNNSQMCL